MSILEIAGATALLVLGAIVARYLLVASRSPTHTKSASKYPPGWNKTADDLRKQKGQFSGQELAWALAYEIDQLKGWARFPCDGETYETLHDVEVTVMIQWAAPFSNGLIGTLKTGTHVRVAVSPLMPESVSVPALPLNYNQIEQELVPETDRTNPKYGGYGLMVKVEQLNKDFRLIPNA